MKKLVIGAVLAIGLAAPAFADHGECCKQKDGKLSACCERAAKGEKMPCCEKHESADKKADGEHAGHQH